MGMQKPDWKKLIRRRLPTAWLSAEAEADLVEELAQLLDDASRDAAVDLSSEEGIDRWLGQQIPEWAELNEAARGREGPLKPRRRTVLQAGSNRAPSPPRALGRLWALVSSAGFSGRRWARKPAFTAVALLSLAVGIAANTAIYSFVHAFKTHTAGLDSPDRLVNIYLESGALLSYPDFEDLRDHTESVFTDVVVSLPILTRGETDSSSSILVGEAVSGSYFDLLGIDMAMGRPLLPSDDLYWGGHPVVVLGHSFWQKAYGSDPEVVGREIELANRPYTIVGVAPASYKGNYYGVFQTDVFAPTMMTGALMAASYDLDQRRDHNCFAKARLKPGSTLAEAQALADSLAAHLRETDVEGWDDEQAFQILPTDDVLVIPGWDPAIRAIGWLLSLATGLVLLLACVNLGSFLLAEALDSRKEMALRLALGGSRGHLVVRLLSESLTLGLCGGLVSLPLAALLLRFLESIELPGPAPFHVDLALDLPVLLFTMAISVAAGLVLGLVPAWRSTDWSLLTALRDTAGGGQRGKTRLRSLLVGTQVAGSTLLLVGAALFFRSLQATEAVETGFGHEPAAILNIRLPANSGEAYRQAALELIEAVDSLPGVLATGVTSNLQLNGYIRQSLDFLIDGVPPSPGRNVHTADRAVVDAGFFAAAGIDIVAGRGFTRSDESADAPVAIISEAMAARFWPGEEALGHEIHTSARDLEVVGVASDTKVNSLNEEPQSFVYLPLRPARHGSMTLIARTSVPPQTLLRRIERVAEQTNPDLWIYDATTMADHHGIVLLPARLSASVLSLVALLATSLAAMGLYGAVGYAVSRRTHEIGIRMSLGADSRSVIALLMAAGLRPVAVGVFTGLVFAVGAGHLARSLLNGVSATDPVILAEGLGVLLLTAAVAAWLPARRASRVDPLKALRTE